MLSENEAIEDPREISQVVAATMERAIRTFPNSNINRSMSSVSMLRIPQREERSDSTISVSMVERLKELRAKFANRTEFIRAQTIFKSKEPTSDEEEEEETEVSKTEEHHLQLSDMDGTKGEEKKAPWWRRYPNRRLVVRQPFCTACLAPHRKHFITFSETPLIRIETPETAVKLTSPEEGKDQPEIIGQELIQPQEFSFSLPAWLPEPRVIFASSFSPYSVFFLLWLMLLTFAVIYNFVTIPLREAFDIYDTETYRFYWFIGNSMADVFYLLDMIIVRPRLEFIENGLIMVDYKSCAKHYAKSTQFKVYTFWETFDRLDQRLNAGFTVRLARTIIYMIYIIHLESCGYYAFNRWEGMNATSWSIPVGNISPYVYSFYICMKTATSIGSLPSATNPFEFMFMTCYWLSGTFVSAILIGQVIDILDSANANKENYRKIMDGALSCMHHLHVPAQVVDKVRTWFMYNWDQQKTFDENSLFDALPIKLKSDLAISVHFHTLSKVSLFQNCERALIYDMILKLKPVVFLPMDYICRKGEVGKEMYIVKSGIVEVVGGPNNSIVFVTLKEGSVFGEISLLALSGKNRRTADVRSKGFSTLFSLSKQDFEEIMKNYPQAHQLLKKRSQRMLNRDKKKAKEEEKFKKASERANGIELSAEEVVEVIPERPPTPRLMDTVVQALEIVCPENPVTQLLLQHRSRTSMDRRRSSYRKYSIIPITPNQEHTRGTESDPDSNCKSNVIPDPPAGDPDEAEKPELLSEENRETSTVNPSHTNSNDENSIDELSDDQQENWYKRLQVKKRPWSDIQTYLLRRC